MAMSRRDIKQILWCEFRCDNKQGVREDAVTY
jgi:hypothetical protein